MLKDTLKSAKELAKQKASKMLSEFIKKDENTIINKLKSAGIKLSQSTLDSKHSEYLIGKIASTIHSALPLTLRIIIRQSTIEQFLSKNKDRLKELLAKL